MPALRGSLRSGPSVVAVCAVLLCVATVCHAQFSWSQIRTTSQTPWYAREGGAMASFNNLLWYTGGIEPSWGGTWYRDQYSSTDGITWTSQGAAQWSARSWFCYLTFQSKLWLLGGNNVGNVLSDVWSSTNGYTWTLGAATPWSARDKHSCVVQPWGSTTRIVLMGGGNGDTGYKSDVWATTNGAAWTQCTAAAAFPARRVGAATVLPSGQIIYGGGTPGPMNDVWGSTDCISWTRLTAAAAWSVRSNFAMLTLNGYALVFVGSAAGSAFTNADLWYSTNGVTWTQSQATGATSRRSDYMYAIHNGQIYISSGIDSAGVLADVYRATQNDNCAAAPCLNGATCNNLLSGVSCSCAPGYSGTYCADFVNFCISAPCQNGGTCTTLLNGYSCGCTSGYTGSTCQIEVNECLTANGGCSGVCVNIPGSRLCGPVFVPASLRQAAPTNLPGPFTVANAIGGQTLQIGLWMGDYTVAQLAFAYGPPDRPSYFRFAGNPVALAPQAGGVQPVQLVLRAGQSNGLVISVWDAARTRLLAVSNTTNTFSYPVPTLSPVSSIALYGHPAEGSPLEPGTTLGVKIQMAGNHFYNDSTVMAVYYGNRPSSPFQYACRLDQQLTTATLLVCTTQDYSSGEDMPFAIVTGDRVVNSTDQISYPSVGVLQSVSGCGTDNVGGTGTTSGCPTSGGTLLTITGSLFLPPVAVFINSASCDSVSLLTSSTLTCYLPPGAGFDQAVIVNTNNQYTQPKNLLSYAPPTISGVSGCSFPVAPNAQSGSAGGVGGCYRNGTSSIQIAGANFGATPATVFVGQSACTVTAQTQSLIVCTVPVGFGLQRGIVVIQKNGVAYSSPYAIDYAQCEAGQYSNGTECHACPLGRSQPLRGQPECVPCVAGYIAPHPGAVQCSACQPGFSSSSDRTVCVACAPGAFAPSPGASACLLCSAGMFAASEQSETCQVCAIGRYAPDQGSVACEPCSAGSYAPNPGRSTCSTCELGRYTNATASATCPECADGTVQPSTGSTTCVPCPVASYSSAAQGVLVQCSACLAGTYSATNGTAQCGGCGPGRYQDLAGQTDCKPCPQGHFTDSTGRSACQLCLGGYYTVHTGQTVCSTCPHPSVSSDDRTSCVCPQGTYLDLDSGACDSCPEGAECDQPGLTTATLLPLSGWWRSNATATFTQCLYKANCVGGAQMCAPHRTGPLCSLCETGYQASTSSSECKRCQSKQTSQGVAGAIFLALIAALLIVFALIWRSDSKAYSRIPRDKRMPIRALDFSAGATNAELKETEVLTTETVTRPTLTFNLKIIIGFFQVATSFVAVLNIPWPSAFESFINALTFINLDFIPWNALNCVAELTFYDRLLIIMLVPIGVLLAILLVVLLPIVLLQRFNYTDDERTREAYRISKSKTLRIILFVCFLVYPNVSATVLSFFQCRTLDGKTYLLADFKLQCFDAEWHRYLVASVFGLIIYPLGIPLVFAYLLFHNRHKLDRPRTLIRLGFLFDAYTKEFWFFELCDLVYKLVMTSMLPFFPGSSSLAVGMSVCTAYTLLLLLGRPYLRHVDDRLHQWCQIEIFLMLTIGWVINTEGAPRPGSSTDTALSVVMILAVCALVGVFCFHIAVYIRKFWRSAQRAQLKAKRLQELAKVRALRTQSTVALALESMAGEDSASGKGAGVRAPNLQASLRGVIQDVGGKNLKQNPNVMFLRGSAVFGLASDRPALGGNGHGNGQGAADPGTPMSGASTSVTRLDDDNAGHNRGVSGASALISVGALVAGIGDGDGGGGGQDGTPSEASRSDASPVGGDTGGAAKAGAAAAAAPNGESSRQFNFHTSVRRHHQHRDSEDDVGSPTADSLRYATSPVASFLSGGASGRGSDAFASPHGGGPRVGSLPLPPAGSIPDGAQDASPLALATATHVRTHTATRDSTDSGMGGGVGVLSAAPELPVVANAADADVPPPPASEHELQSLPPAPPVDASSGAASPTSAAASAAASPRALLDADAAGSSAPNSPAAAAAVVPATGRPKPALPKRPSKTGGAGGAPM